MKEFDYFEEKPKSLKVLQGTYRNDREEKNIPQTKKVTEVPKPFPWICNSGKKVFRAIVNDLVESGILSEIDLHALNAACHEFGKYMDYEKYIKKEGRYKIVTKTTSTGDLYTVEELRPEVKLSKDALKAAHEQFKVFGLNPLDRSKLHIPDKNKEKDKEPNLRKTKGGTA